MGCNFGDLDNDGFLDSYLGTGYPDVAGLMPNVMYRNVAGRRFEDVTASGGFGHLQKGHGVAFHDWDNDGDQDVFAELGGWYDSDVFQNAMFENPGNDHHWVRVQLRGVGANRMGIGAKLRIDVAEDDVQRTIYRHVNHGSSFGANPLAQTIGLGAASVVKQLTVYWPGSGTIQTFGPLEADRAYELIEGDARPVVVVLPHVFRASGEGTDGTN